MLVLILGLYSEFLYVSDSEAANWQHKKNDTIYEHAEPQFGFVFTADNITSCIFLPIDMLLACSGIRGIQCSRPHTVVHPYCS